MSKLPFTIADSAVIRSKPLPPVARPKPTGADIVKAIRASLTPR